MVVVVCVCVWRGASGEGVCLFSSILSVLVLGRLYMGVPAVLCIHGEAVQRQPC